MLQWCRSDMHVFPLLRSPAGVQMHHAAHRCVPGLSKPSSSDPARRLWRVFPLLRRERHSSHMAGPQRSTAPQLPHLGAQRCLREAAQWECSHSGVGTGVQQKPRPQGGVGVSCLVLGMNTAGCSFPACLPASRSSVPAI